MNTEYQMTPEERAYYQLLDELWESLSEPARTVLGEADAEAYKFNLCHNYAYQLEEYDEAKEKMRLAAAALTDRDHKLVAQLWRAALAAAASIDSEDFETLARPRAYSGDLHRYYRMQSGMVEAILRDKKEAEFQKEITERAP